MYMVDFVYDGKMLSEYGYMVAHIVSELEDSVSLGSKMTINTFQNNSTYENHIASIEYSEPISVTFDVCRNLCSAYPEELTDEEISFFMKWLNKEEYKEFQPIYNNSAFEDIVYDGSFNLTAIYEAGKIYGFTLTFTANSPFGRTKEKNYQVSAQKEFRYFNTSDKMGVLFPKKCQIRCLEDGDLTISSNIYDKITIIKNCKAGEIINFDGANEIITCDSHEKIYNDFNYNYPCLVAKSSPVENVLSFSLVCDMDISISEIRKVGIFV